MSGLPDEHAASREPGGPEERVSPSLLIIQQLGQIGQQISRLEVRYDAILHRFDRLEQRIEHLGAKVDAMAQRLEGKIDGVGRALDDRISGLVRWAVGALIAVLGSAAAIVVTVVLHR